MVVSEAYLRGAVICTAEVVKSAIIAVPSLFLIYKLLVARINPSTSLVSLADVASLLRCAIVVESSAKKTPSVVQSTDVDFAPS